MADTFTLKQGDTAPALLVACEGDEGPVDLSAASGATLVLANEAGVAVRRVASILPGTDGLVRYDWSPDDTATAGTYRAEVEIAWVAGVVQTFPGKGFLRVRVEPSLG